MMAWVIGLLFAILIVLVGGILLINWQIGLIGAEVQRHLARLRLEVGAGLGVNIDHPHGYLDGGHLNEIRDDVRERRKKERKAAALESV